MIIEYARDNRNRVCACCDKKIVKGDLYVRDEEVIDGWNNTRMFFAHIQCLILKLINLKEKAEKELKKIQFEITRHVGKYQCTKKS